MNGSMAINQTDEELMLLYQSGNEEAFKKLYDRYHGRVYSYLLKRLNENIWVDDVFQMVFSKLHRTRHQFNPKYNFDQWIFVVTKTVLLDFWKTTAVKTKRYFSESIDDLAQNELPIAQPQSLFQNEQAGSISEPILASLSSDQKSVIEMKFVDELSYNEIAIQLRRSEESVRQLASRAIKKIRSHIKKDNKGSGGIP